MMRRVAFGSDMPGSIVSFVASELASRGLEVVKLGAAKTGKEEPWPEVGQQVAELVTSGQCQEGVVMCWTGTGVAIAASKVPGARAALCLDAETAKGARKWDHANILALSIRSTSEQIAKEILDAWFSTPFDEKEKPVVDMVAAIEKRYSFERR